MKKTKEEKMKFGSEIKFEGLFRHAEKFTGTVLTFNQPVIKEGRNEKVHIEIQSENIAPTCGVFGKILTSCVVESFSNEILENGETGELFYWVNLHLGYQHKSGGTNGMELFTAWYKNGEWTFRD